MTSVFSFSGQIRRAPYALVSLSLFFSQHLLVWLTALALGRTLQPDFWFLVIPLRALATQMTAPEWVLIAVFAYGLAATWVLAALAVRRAANANTSGWVGTIAVVPILQILVIAGLAVVPPAATADSTPSSAAAGASDRAWVAAAQGLIAGIALTLFAVVVSTLVFGVYGYGVFVVSPLLVGAITAFLANRVADLGQKRTNKIVIAATLLGGAGLVLAAIEGVVCILMAAPLGLGMAWLGGHLGRHNALARKRPARQALSAFAALPLVFALEYVSPSTTSFDTHQTVEINAPPDAVWRSILHMDTMAEPTALLFRLGVAYPIRGEVIGEGIGATRHGMFSTGTAVERVTEWVPERRLAFVVVKDVPAIREISPYEHVHAPHAIGYFNTTLTSFELVPLPSGRTEVIERTAHQLKLDPILYWLPLTRWIVQHNNARVLLHIKHQAERSAESGS